MTAIEIAQAVVDQKQAHLFRIRRGTTDQYDAKVWCGSKAGWTILDGYTASAIIAVHNGLNETNRPLFARLPLVKMAMVAFKLMK